MTWIEFVIPFVLAALLGLHFVAVARAANKDDYEEEEQKTNQKKDPTVTDPTENVRRVLVTTINEAPRTREDLEAVYGKGNVFDTEELQEQFFVQGFAAPFCVVHRKSDGKLGSLTFQHAPRFYFDFVEDPE